MFIFSDKVYNALKKFVQIILPALGTLYFTLGNLWGFPAIEEVLGTFTAIATFLGVVMGISSSTYDKLDKAYDGNVIITTTHEGKKLFSLEVNGDPMEIEQMGAIRFKVKTVEEVA